MRWSVRFLALAQVALVLAACSAVPGTTSSTSSSPTSEPSSVAVSAPPPSVEPSASAPGDGVGLPAVGIDPDTYARVVVDNLRVRSKPEVSDGSKKLEPLLQDGVRLLILDGPLLASGYDWYQVKPIFDADTPEGGYPFGWVARAGKDGESWIEPESVNCPPIPTDVSSLSALFGTPYYAITCDGGQDITFKARLGVEESFSCGIHGQPWGTEPEWLDGCQVDPPFLAALDNLRLVIGPQWAPEVDMTIAPDPVVPPDAWPIVEVTGQFDHPAAMTCRNHLNDPGTDVPEPDPALTVLNCRDWFVVTSMREVEG